MPAGLKDSLRFTRFVKQTVRREGFDRLIVFGAGTSCLLAGLLLRYGKRFIIDYRDLSIEQKPGFRQLFSLVSRLSYANVISSPGFKRCLPSREYLISHNFDSNAVREIIGQTSHEAFSTNDSIDVLTIGGIRDYDSNIEVVKALANLDGFRCFFVGKGAAAPKIEKFCKENAISNVTFHGYYEKEEEPEFVNKATFLNIFYPRKISHDTAMSNRFYNSLLFKRPMIVTKGTTQGDYAEKYQVGIAVENCSNLASQLSSFLQTDFNQYAKRCNSLLRLFLEEDNLFKDAVRSFVGV
jgi:hypothetical protein